MKDKMILLSSILQIKLSINDQGIEVLNTRVDKFLWQFNIIPTTLRIEFINQILNIVVVALNASNIAVLNEFQLLDLDLDVQDQSFQTLIDTSVDVVLIYQ